MIRGIIGSDLQPETAEGGNEDQHRLLVVEQRQAWSHLVLQPHPSPRAALTDAFPPAWQLKSLTAFDAAADGSVLRNIPCAPEYVDNVQKLEAGKICYTQVGADCNGGQSDSSATVARTFPTSLPPATFYGKVRTPAGKPAAGSTLAAAG